MYLTSYGKTNGSGDSYHGSTCDSNNSPQNASMLGALSQTNRGCKDRHSGSSNRSAHNIAHW